MLKIKHVKKLSLTGIVYCSTYINDVWTKICIG